MILCLGEGLVDLICERPVRSLAEADSFRPHFGGALANVAVAVSRAGVEAGLAGAAGDDEWGRWLAECLEREGVDLDFFELMTGEQTPIAFASFDEHGEPSFEIYGDAVAVALASVAPRVEEAIAAAGALVYSSTTLATASERDVTLRARELALARGARVCFDPNIRPNRWGGDPRRAAAASRELIAGSFLVRTNRDEAMAITELDDPRSAADELAAMGAELAVVTLGEEGAVMRGAPARPRRPPRRSRSSRRSAPATPSWARSSPDWRAAAGMPPAPARRSAPRSMRPPTPARAGRALD